MTADPRHAQSQAEVGVHTRERLLDAAEDLFAARGFAAASVRDITRQAGCNVAAVNYHFGGKLGLYREMFRRRLAALREQRIGSVRQAMAAGAGQRALESVLSAFAGAFLEPLVEQSRGRLLVELWSREMLDPQLPPETFEIEIAGPVQEVLTDAILAAAPGLSREAARLCVLSLVGQLVQVAHRVRRNEPLEPRDADTARLSAMVRHIVRFSAGGIRACAGDRDDEPPPRSYRRHRPGQGLRPMPKWRTNHA